MRPRVAVVVQRYGADVAGGSETLARAVAERLARDAEVVAFASCARDYVTWRNELPEGERIENGVEVRRFPSEAERDLAAFNRLSDALYDRPHSEEQELEWLKRQGPDVPRLVQRLEAERDRYDAVLFFTYLYFPTYWGLRAAPERAILVPTAHDEPPLRLEIMKRVFQAPRAFAFCSAPEEELVRSRFYIDGRPRAVTGMGVDVERDGLDVEGFRIRHDVRGAYALYAGRIDAGKGCDAMLAHFGEYRRRVSGGAELLLIGRLAMESPRVPGVRYLGFLPEREKLAALAGARAVICPSPYESLSIVLLEAMALGTPVVATAASPVLVDHCQRSNAGLFYGDRAEFTEALDLLVKTEPLRSAMGENGRRYVAANYRWDAVMARYKGLIAAVSGKEL
ncbi:MAG TPA: glycosyltransferase family 4 protein [Vicinamibacteria bacterium]|nr:glycosyltransferase family 4 protein [Vicinamibacteria bacterium]